MKEAPRSPARRAGRALAVILVCVLGLVALLIAVRPSLLPTVAHTGDAASEPANTTRIDVIHTGGDAASTPGARAMTALPSAGKHYFGVSVAKPDPGPDPSAAFTREVGVSPTLQMFFESFADTFDTTTARRITAAGRLPMLTWEPYDWHQPAANRYPLADIATGRFDAYLKADAARFASVPGPLVIRFAHEMNGGWYPWGVGGKGNTAAAYVTAFRHVHDVVSAAGATNVVWMWAPNVIDADPSITLAPLYPGDDVVDWVGISGYFTKSTDAFASRFGPTLKQLNAVAPTKPLMLAETAVPPTADREAQIADLVNGVLHASRFIGLIWFDVAKRADWSVDHDPKAAGALGAAIRAGGFGATPRAVGR